MTPPIMGGVYVVTSVYHVLGGIERTDDDVYHSYYTGEYSHYCHYHRILHTWFHHHTHHICILPIEGLTHEVLEIHIQP